MHPIEILNASRPRISKVVISSGELHVRALNAGAFNDMMERRAAGERGAFSNMELIAACLCDENGKLVFESIEVGLPIIKPMCSKDSAALALEICLLSDLRKPKEEDEKKS